MNPRKDPRKAIAVRVILTVVVLLVTSILLTIHALKPDIAHGFFWYVFGGSFLSGLLLANMFTNISYLFFRE